MAFIDYTSGGSYKLSYPEVNLFVELPLAIEHVNEKYIVKNASGIYILGTKKEAGIYFSDGITWKFLGNSVTIDDNTVNTDKVWSSNKVNNLFVSATFGTSNAILVNELKNAFKSAYATSYSEILYSDGNIVEINVYQTEYKTKHLFRKVFLYNIEGNIIEINTTDIENGKTYSLNLEYDIIGNISNKKTQIV